MSSTADVARPSALREASCERSAPVIARLFFSLVLQPLPPGEAERRVPDRETVRPNLERTDSPALLPLDSVSMRNNLGLARSPFVPRIGVRGRPRAFPARAGETEGPQGGGRPPSGLLSLAEPAYAPRPSPAATTVLMTGFRQRFVRPLRRLSRLVAGTAGGSCVGDPVLPRSLPVYLIQLSFFCLASEGCACPGRGDSSFFRTPFQRPFGSALVVYITTYVV